MIEDLRQKLLRHVRFLESELADASRFGVVTNREYIGSNDLRRNVERWAENLVNSLIDISKIAVTIEKIPLADNYREIVQSIIGVPEFSRLDASLLSSWVKLGNVLAHEYLDARWRALERFLRESPPALRQFLESAKSYLRRITPTQE